MESVNPSMGGILIRDQQGFTLIESLVSVAILAIGFAGVFGLVGVSDRMLHNSMEREELDDQSNEILETLYSDTSNIEVYKDKDLSNCGAIKVAKGKDLQLKQMQRWCNRIKNEMGTQQGQDRRKIHVTKTTIAGGRTVYVVAIELTSKDGTNSSWVKKVFNAP